MLVDLLQQRSQNQGGNVAYTFLLAGTAREKEITYGELDLKARSIAAELQQFALPGDRAVLLFPPGLDYIAAFFGCLYAGVVCVRGVRRRGSGKNERLISIINDSAPRAALTSAVLLARVRSRLIDPRYPDMMCIATDIVDSGLAERWKEGLRRNDDL